MEYFFMFIGLGFFLFVIWMIQVGEERMYQRKLNEQREFGYEKRRRRIQKELDKL
jgi:hypothetical protein